MKNNVWIAISFSMLAAAASAGASEIISSETQTQEVQTPQGAEEAGSLVKSLGIGQVPTFENALPCYAR